MGSRIWDVVVAGQKAKLCPTGSGPLNGRLEWSLREAGVGVTTVDLKWSAGHSHDGQRPHLVCGPVRKLVSGKN